MDTPGCDSHGANTVGVSGTIAVAHVLSDPEEAKVERSI
jgi:hypothetical protein